MKGKWKPSGQVINGKYMYIATRKLDMSKPLHSGNIECYGKYSEDKAAIAAICAIMNKKEGGD